MGGHSGNVQDTSEFICEICLINYDAINRKPYSLVPCGHTFCIMCMNEMQTNNCPVCRANFSNKIPNWEILKRLKSSVPSAPGLSAQEIPTLVANRNENRQSVYDNFFAMSSKRKFVFFYSIFLAMVFLIYPFALLWVGIEHRSECYIDKWIPVWMMVYGLFGILMVAVGFFLIQYLMLKPKNLRSRKVMSVLTTIGSLLTLFEFSWFFVGTVWVFRAYPNVTYSTYNLKDSITTYCAPDMYKFAFGTLVAQCCIFGLFLCSSPCLFCCLPWRRLNEI